MVNAGVAELDKETKDFFDSAGSVAPSEAPEPEVKQDALEPEAKEVKQEEPAPEPEAKEVKQDTKEVKQEADPHAENHRKALKETREEFKAFKRQVAEEKAAREAELAAMRAKFEEFTAVLGKPVEQKIPEFNEDPANHLLARMEETKKRIQDIEARNQAEQQAREQAAAVHRFQATLRQHESEFMKEHQDYDDAAKHIGAIWMEEIKLAGVPEDVLGQAFQMRVAQFASAAVKRGENPAQAVYALAQRAGYRPKEAQKPASEKRIESIQQGMEASKTLGGGKQSVDITLESLSNMSQEDIERLAADPVAWRKAAAGI